MRGFGGVTPPEFFYWLQGFFELRRDDDPLTMVQATCISRHASLVLESGATAPGVVRVQTMAHMLEAGLDPTIITASIKKAVAEVFEHVIDPSAGGPDVQEKLNAIHGPAPLVRC